MSKSHGERKLSTCRNTAHRRTRGGERHRETRSHPRTDVLDEEPLVRRKPFWIETRRILMEPQSLVSDAVHTDDHGRRHVECVKKPAPLRDHLTVTGEYDRVGLIWRDVHRDLPTTVVVERFGDKLTCDWVSRRPLRRCLG